MSLNLVDPLKVKAMGVKKPFDEKGNSLQALEEQGNRYYPADARGNVDEWAAVIKRRTEAYEREMQEKQILKQD